MMLMAAKFFKWHSDTKLRASRMRGHSVEAHSRAARAMRRDAHARASSLLQQHRLHHAPLCRSVARGHGTPLLRLSALLAQERAHALQLLRRAR
jgi:hypothetical protein